MCDPVSRTLLSTSAVEGADENWCVLIPAFSQSSRNCTVWSTVKYSFMWRFIFGPRYELPRIGLHPATKRETRYLPNWIVGIFAVELGEPAWACPPAAATPETAASIPNCVRNSLRSTRRFSSVWDMLGASLMRVRGA